ncbi:MAG: hypothetical protein AAF267_24380 [Deinococcota bacterium]
MSNSKNSEGAKVPCDGISCSLSAEELKNHRDDLIPGLFHRSDRVEEITNGFRFMFSRKPNLLIELAELIEKENLCCSFLSFVLSVGENNSSVSLEVSGPPGTVELLRSL